jgi:hypothetical protein
MITRDPRWRIQQLESLLKGFEKMAPELCEACFKDLGRSNQFTKMCEITPMIDLLNHTID